MDTKDLYLKIIDIVNHFLLLGSNLTISALKNFNPSVDELAAVMRTLANVLKDLAADSYDDQNMAINAFQCCLVMERLANTVKMEDEEALEDIIRELEMHTQVPL